MLAQIIEEIRAPDRAAGMKECGVNDFDVGLQEDVEPIRHAPVVRPPFSTRARTSYTCVRVPEVLKR